MRDRTLPGTLGHGHGQRQGGQGGQRGQGGQGRLGANNIRRWSLSLGTEFCGAAYWCPAGTSRNTDTGGNLGSRCVCLGIRIIGGVLYVERGVVFVVFSVQLSALAAVLCLGAPCGSAPWRRRRCRRHRCRPPLCRCPQCHPPCYRRLPRPIIPVPSSSLPSFPCRRPMCRAVVHYLVSGIVIVAPWQCHMMREPNSNSSNYFLPESQSSWRGGGG